MTKQSKSVNTKKNYHNLNTNKQRINVKGITVFGRLLVLKKKDDGSEPSQISKPIE